MKRMKMLFSLLVLFAALIVGYNSDEAPDSRVRVSLAADVSADGGSTYDALPDELDSILEEFKGLLPEGFSADADEISESIGIEALFEYIASAFAGTRSGIASFFMTLLGVSVLFAVSEQALPDSCGAGARSALGAVLVIPVFMGISPLIGSVSEGIETSSAFFSSVIPVMSAVTAAGGLGATAAAESVGMNITLGMISGFLSENLLPLVSVMFSLSLVSAMDAPSHLAKICSSLRSLFLFLLGLCCTALVAVLALQTVITSASDSMTMRGVKYAVSGMLPIVGSTVSASLSFLASGVGFVSKIVGVSSVGVIVSAMGAPLIELLLYKACFSVCISFSEMTGASSGVRILSSLRGCIDALIAVFSAVMIVYIAEIIIFISCAERAFSL